MADRDSLVVLRGAGDLASGVAWILFREGYGVAMSEVAQPRAVRRAVSFCEAVYEGEKEVEGLIALRCTNPDEAREKVEAGEHIIVVVDPGLDILSPLSPWAVVDARMLKRPPGSRPTGVELWIGLGPGFTAGVDVDAVVETQRGPTLGMVYFEGAALPNTGIPGDVGGQGARRVVRSPADGLFQSSRSIGDLVEEGEPFGSVGMVVIPAPLSGRIRGLLRPGLAVTTGDKIGDVDPRGRDVLPHLISDKARAVGRGVLQALEHFRRQGR